MAAATSSSLADSRSQMTGSPPAARTSSACSGLRISERTLVPALAQAPASGAARSGRGLLRWRHSIGTQPTRTCRVRRNRRRSTRARPGRRRVDEPRRRVSEQPSLGPARARSAGAGPQDGRRMPASRPGDRTVAGPSGRRSCVAPSECAPSSFSAERIISGSRLADEVGRRSSPRVADQRGDRAGRREAGPSGDGAGRDPGSSAMKRRAGADQPDRLRDALDAVRRASRPARRSRGSRSVSV